MVVNQHTQNAIRSHTTTLPMRNVWHFFLTQRKHCVLPVGFKENKKTDTKSLFHGDKR